MNIIKKNILNITKKFLVLLFFFLSYLIPKKKKLYIFWSIDGKSFSWNSKALFLYYLLHKWYDVYYILDKKNFNIQNEFKNNFIIKWEIKHYWLCLRSKFIFIDWSISMVWFSSLIMWNFNIINLWHWDPIKKIWFSNKFHINSRLGNFFLDNFYYNKIKLSFTWNSFSKIHLEEAFKTKHFVTWLARYDVFFDNILEIQKIPKLLNLNKFNKILLYAPTWRDTEENISPFSFSFLEKFNFYLKNKNYLLLIKWHFNSGKIKINEFSNIRDISNIDFDIQELLNNIDLLITDYSSIYIDFLLTNKPILFYAYDLNKYITKDREMYYNYYDIIIKSTLVENEINLLEKINDIDSIKNTDKYIIQYKKIKDHFHRYQKWWFCKRINKYIQKLEK